jgi:pimeloyl-ACP methyl ester carboxylesterase
MTDRDNQRPTPTTTGFETLSGTKIEVERRGQGTPMLVLYGEEALELDAPFLEELAQDHELIIPSPPGFGRSERPDWITSPDDIAYIYLDLIEKLTITKAPVLGFSLGGWIAAEMATKSSAFLSKLVLVGAFGIKPGGPFDRDIQDVWALPPDRVTVLKWSDTAKAKRDFASMSDEQLTIVARNAESFARFCWEPYMYNPKLKHRLHRIAAPTLLVWGANDGIVTPEYGKAYSSLIPGAQLALVPKAGHYPHLEQPQLFMQRVREFLR